MVFYSIWWLKLKLVNVFNNQFVVKQEQARPMKDDIEGFNEKATEYDVTRCALVDENGKVLMKCAIAMRSSG